METVLKQIRFLEEIEAICKKYDLSISHQDSQGAFIIEKYSDFNMDWLKDAIQYKAPKCKGGKK